MAWYRWPCGFITEVRPRFGYSIVSVSHLHKASRLDGTSAIARMEEIPDPALERATVHRATTRPAVPPRPERRAA